MKIPTGCKDLTLIRGDGDKRAEAELTLTEHPSPEGHALCLGFPLAFAQAGYKVHIHYSHTGGFLAQEHAAGE
jgi:hypothetical protein